MKDRETNERRQHPHPDLREQVRRAIRRAAVEATPKAPDAGHVRPPRLVGLGMIRAVQQRIEAATDPATIEALEERRATIVRHIGRVLGITVRAGREHLFIRYLAEARTAYATAWAAGVDTLESEHPRRFPDRVKAAKREHGRGRLARKKHRHVPYDHPRHDPDGPTVAEAEGDHDPRMAAVEAGAVIGGLADRARLTDLMRATMEVVADHLNDAGHVEYDAWDVIAAELSDREGQHVDSAAARRRWDRIKDRLRDI
ncbi:MAG: hypothetical protein R6U63_13830 [Longimicrobiales bacterium]